jgi:hypothetical protein
MSLKTENSRRVAKSRPICMGLKYFTTMIWKPDGLNTTANLLHGLQQPVNNLHLECAKWSMYTHNIIRINNINACYLGYNNKDSRVAHERSFLFIFPASVLNAVYCSIGCTGGVRSWSQFGHSLSKTNWTKSPLILWSMSEIFFKWI